MIAFEARLRPRRRRARRLCVDRTDGEFCASVAFDSKLACIERQRKVFCDKRVVASRQIECDQACDVGAVGIDGDGIHYRCHVHISRACRRIDCVGSRLNVNSRIALLILSISKMPFRPR